MTIERRLARVEGSLEPRQIVLRILAEAHQFDGLDAYTRSLVALPEEAAPLSRIATEIEASVRASRKGEPRDTVEAAVRHAVGDGAFLFLLVLQLNVAALEVDRLEGLRAATLFFWMGCLLGGPRSADLEAGERIAYEKELAADWRSWTTTLEDLVGCVAIEEEARSILETRYLDGHAALFADAAATWAGLRNQVDRLAVIASDLSPISQAAATRRRRSGSGTRTNNAGGRERTAEARERARHLADDARIRVFDLLGERHRALTILERRLTSTPKSGCLIRASGE